MYNENECVTAGCRKDATHTVTILVLARGDLPEFINEFQYCLDDALYFAAWLPYCYPDQYELISIRPPASELFK